VSTRQCALPRGVHTRYLDADDGPFGDDDDADKDRRLDGLAGDVAIAVLDIDQPVGWCADIADLLVGAG